MGHSSTGDDVLQTVAKRSPLLEHLDDGPAAKHELIAVLDCSRSTIDRAIRELEALDCIRRCEGGFRLTVAGRLALTAHRRSRQTFESIAQTSDLLRELPTETPISTDLIRGATLLEVPAHAPNEPLEEIVELIDRAERFRAIAAADRMPAFRRQFRERAIDDAFDVELVVTESLARVTLTDHADILNNGALEGEVDVYTVPTVPYELSIVETPTESVAYVVPFDDDLTYRGVIRNDSTAALEWAHDAFRRHRATARPISAFDQRTVD